MHTTLEDGRRQGGSEIVDIDYPSSSTRGPSYQMKGIFRKLLLPVVSTSAFKCRAAAACADCMSASLGTLIRPV